MRVNWLFLCAYFCSQLLWPSTLAAVAAEPVACAGSTAMLGTSRVVSVSKEKEFKFGLANYPAPKFLKDKEVILTFDDGPSPEVTPLILEALKSNCTHATFFILGMRAEEHPELVKQAIVDGHTIGTHTYSHPDLSVMKTGSATNEIQKGIRTVRSIAGGSLSSFFRYPYLRDTAQLNRYLAKNGIVIASTDIDSFDYTDIPATKIVENVMGQLSKNGRGILMMHDIMPETAKALPDLLKRLHSEGYSVVQMAP